MPWLVWLSLWSAGLQTKRLPVRFPVGAQAWAAGWVLGWGLVRSNQLMFLSLSFSFPSPLFKNKYIKS